MYIYIYWFPIRIFIYLEKKDARSSVWNHISGCEFVSLLLILLWEHYWYGWIEFIILDLFRYIKINWTCFDMKKRKSFIFSNCEKCKFLMLFRLVANINIFKKFKYQDGIMITELFIDESTRYKQTLEQCVLVKSIIFILMYSRDWIYWFNGLFVRFISELNFEKLWSCLKNKISFLWWSWYIYHIKMFYLIIVF